MIVIIKNKKFSRPSLKDFDSKKATNRADSEGKSDEEIIEEAKKAGKETGKKVGTALGLGLGTFETIRGIKKIKDFEKNPEKIKELGKGIKEAQAQLPKDLSEAINYLYIKPGKKVAKKLLKNPKKYGKFAKLAAIGGGSLTVISSRELGKAIGKRSAEINTVDQLEKKRHELSKK